MTRVKRSLAAATVASGLAAVCANVAGSDSSDPQHSGRKLVLSDSFSSSRLDARHWSTCYWWAVRACTIATNSELELYEPSQVRVDHGVVRLVAERRTATATGHRYQFASGMISSGPTGSRVSRFSFRYGLAEIRMRVPAGAGLWPAFWLLPTDRSSEPEIDVAEVFGQRPRTVQMHLHYRDARGQEKVRGADWTQRSLADGWHRFAIDWQPRRLVWLVDGVPRWQLTGAAVPSTPMYLIANLAVGGTGAGSPTSRTPFPSELDIDWVRVWQ